MSKSRQARQTAQQKGTVQDEETGGEFTLVEVGVRRRFSGISRGCVGGGGWMPNGEWRLKRLRRMTCCAE
jgi:hypothetical protein